MPSYRRSRPAGGTGQVRSPLATSALALTVALALACGGGEERVGVRIEPVPSPAAGARGVIAPPARRTVFLDPGHGGRDPGWGASYLLPGMPPEKDLDLDLAKRTAAHLE